MLSRWSQNLHVVGSEPVFLALSLIKVPKTFNVKDEKLTVAAVFVIGLISKHGKVLENAFKAWFWTYNEMNVQNQALYIQNQVFFSF